MRYSLNIFIALFLLFISMCSTRNYRHTSDTFSPTDSPAGQVQVYELPPFRALTKDNSWYVLLELSLQFNNNTELYREISLKEGLIKNSISSIIMKKYHYEIDSIDEYDRLHEEIIKEINPLLHKGDIQKVFFRNYEIKNQRGMK